MEIRSLNPCCSGQWSRTVHRFYAYCMDLDVLILVVVDNGLVLPLANDATVGVGEVLILVVVDNGLVHRKTLLYIWGKKS